MIPPILITPQSSFEIPTNKEQILIQDFSNRKFHDASAMMAYRDSIIKSTLVILNEEKIVDMGSDEFSNLIHSDTINRIKIIRDSTTTCLKKTIILITTR